MKKTARGEMKLSIIDFDYTEARRIKKPLRPTRNFGKFFDDAEAESWAILKSYGFKRKAGELPDDATRIKHTEADVQVACRVLENVYFGRKYWNALQGERSRAESFAFNVAVIIEQRNGVAEKAISAHRKKHRTKQIKRDADPYKKRNERIAKVALRMLSGDIELDGLLKQIREYAIDNELTSDTLPVTSRWPTTIKQFRTILRKQRVIQ